MLAFDPRQKQVPVAIATGTPMVDQKVRMARVDMVPPVLWDETLFPEKDQSYRCSQSPEFHSWDRPMLRVESLPHRHYTASRVSLS